jgi:hypothetical protein
MGLVRTRTNETPDTVQVKLWTSATPDKCDTRSSETPDTGQVRLWTSANPDNLVIMNRGEEGMLELCKQ